MVVTMANVRLFNTMTRKIEDLTPIHPGKIGMYCCGPTVYNFQHIGNFKTFLFEDILDRTLNYAGYDVTHVMNITDVGHLTGDNDEGEDKMAVAMRREKKKSEEIADFYTAKFFEDWDKLNLKRPTIVCKATEHIADMIELIKRIEAAGYTYQAGGNVYFDVSKFKDYGKLAKLDLDKLQAGARVDVDQNKKNGLDFVLWFTKSKFENQELTWDSPWGRGYPGWHIECSAMSMKYLGEEFDIHCGGIDHIPVHHTNEIAQSEAATGKQCVRVWMHSEFLLLNDQKMSKSTGSFLVLNDVINQGFDPLVYRMLVLSAHYKAQLNFSLETMETMKRTLEKLRNSVLSLKAAASAEKSPAHDSAKIESYKEAFKEGLFNDLNTPQALAVVWKVIGDNSLSATDRLEMIYDFDNVLGLRLKDLKEDSVEITPELQALLDERQAAKANKDWPAADAARDKIQALGYKVVDTAEGPKLKKI